MNKELLDEIGTYLFSLSAVFRLAERFLISDGNMQLASIEDKDEPEGRLLVLMSDTMAQQVLKTLEKYAENLNDIVKELPENEDNGN